ncbi:NAD(P)-dependent oxidoreductase [Rhodococcus daqingensis]|uniref:NAD(P)-dependent oxidoreductase n=1 Tax=Rhodococcus daqingensis TaxID=2479363 RepID=A0ABW2RTM7_9NOCA
MKICWIGLGAMGFPMAGHLNEAGYEVTGFDHSLDACIDAAAARIPVADSVQDAAEDADVLITMLPRGDHVRGALFDSAALAAAAPGALVIDCSTIGATDACDIGAAVAATGRRFLDAPVSGGTGGAQHATLTFMVGGAAADLDDARPLLESMGTHIFHAGAVGTGQSAKMVNSMMLAVNMQSTCEAAVLARRLDVAPETVIEIARLATGDNSALRNYYPVAGAVAAAPSSRKFTGGLAATQMRQNLGLALDAAAEHGVDASATAEVARRLDRIIADGHGNLDYSVLVRLLDDTVDAGVPQAVR